MPNPSPEKQEQLDAEPFAAMAKPQRPAPVRTLAFPTPPRVSPLQAQPQPATSDGDNDDGDGDGDVGQVAGGVDGGGGVALSPPLVDMPVSRPSSGWSRRSGQRLVYVPSELVARMRQVRAMSDVTNTQLVLAALRRHGGRVAGQVAASGEDAFPSLFARRRRGLSPVQVQLVMADSDEAELVGWAEQVGAASLSAAVTVLLEQDLSR